MNVHLVDVDSKIANLALMQASSYHKSRGDSVTLTRHRISRSRVRESFPLVTPQADVAYVSCVFGWNRPSAERLAGALERWGATVLRGGTGFDVGPAGNFPPPGRWSELPPEIARCPPDYDLYGEDYALGFCRRGCNRRCEFCVAWRKEGTIRGPMAHPSSWVPDGFQRAMLLDNDLALYPPSDQEEILGWFSRTGVRGCLTQGYDARAIRANPDLARLLAEHKPWDLAFKQRMVYLAWDYIEIEPAVRFAIRSLLDAGFGPREITVYTIVGHRTTHAQDLYRAKVLWEEFKVVPYAMIFNDRRDDPWIRAFARWVNRPRLFKTIAWADFKGNPANRVPAPASAPSPLTFLPLPPTPPPEASPP